MQPELKKGTAEVLILSLLEHRARHGYELAKLIEKRSRGVLEFHVASLYPMLYRLERRGWIEGRWLEKAGQRRRRFYKLTTAGRRALPEQRKAGGNLSAQSSAWRRWEMRDWKQYVREHLPPLRLERSARAGNCRRNRAAARGRVFRSNFARGLTREEADAHASRKFPTGLRSRTKSAKRNNPSRKL